MWAVNGKVSHTLIVGIWFENGFSTQIVVDKMWTNNAFVVSNTSGFKAILKMLLISTLFLSTFQSLLNVRHFFKMLPGF